jgi:AcrR family transcriptional regulator
MSKSASRTSRREESLSRDRIVQAAVDLLDRHGPDGLTFKALSAHLATGPGAIYWHIANKSELLTAACDSLVARTLPAHALEASPAATIRALAMALFDLIDAHPWIGAALTQAPGKSPMVRILEALGQPLRALGVPPGCQWSTVFALASYVLGVAGQNAANAQQARQMDGTGRADFLDALATTWSRLDPVAYPFTRGIAAQFRVHDDRADFLAGVDLILGGIAATHPPRATPGGASSSASPAGT